MDAFLLLLRNLYSTVLSFTWASSMCAWHHSELNLKWPWSFLDHTADIFCCDHCAYVYCCPLIKPCFPLSFQSMLVSSVLSSHMRPIRLQDWIHFREVGQDLINKFINTKVTVHKLEVFTELQHLYTMCSKPEWFAQWAVTRSWVCMFWNCRDAKQKGFFFFLTKFPSVNVFALPLMLWVCCTSCKAERRKVTSVSEQPALSQHLSDLCLGRLSCLL